VRRTPPPTGSLRPPPFASEPPPVVESSRDVPALHASFRHHFGQGAIDEATEVARALVHLGAADALEQRLASAAPKGIPTLARPLGPELVRAYVAHDDEDPALGAIFAALWPVLLPLRSRTERDLGLRPSDEIDHAASDDPFAKLFAHAARSLGVDLPRLFIRREVPGGLAFLPLVTPGGASLCGGTLASGFDPATTLHVIAHHVAYYRPEVYVLALTTSDEDASTAVLAALHATDRLPSLDPAVVSVADALSRHLSVALREALRTACLRYPLPPRAPQELVAEEVAYYRRAAFLTAVRCGFALAGDLAVSARIQRVMPALPGLSIEAVLDDLVTYAVSASWLAVRKEVGIALAPGGG
jgi:hypothetical protein